MSEEREFIVHWTLSGTSKVKAKDREDAYNKAMDKRDISDKEVGYSVEYIEK